MAVGDSVALALAFLPPPLVLFVISMVPFIELRGAVPVGILLYRMDWQQVLLISIIGNMVPIPLILRYAAPVERWFRRFERWDRWLDRLFARTRRKHAKRVERFGVLLLLLFVSIPLPVTGAWMGALLAYLYDLPKMQALGAIFGGVVIAGLLVTGLSELLLTF